MGYQTTVKTTDHSAYFALPEKGSGPGVLVLHAWWGLNDDVRGFCDLLAGRGFVALAPGLYPDDKTAATIAEAEALIEEHDSDPSIAARVLLAAVDQLGAMPEVNSDQIGVVGFSMGAYWALWLADKRPEHVGAVASVYGSSDTDFQSASAAFQLHFAENDDYEPPHAQQALEQTLIEAGKDVELFVYPGTGHWFVEPSRTDAYDAEAAALLWDRTAAFLRSQLS